MVLLVAVILFEGALTLNFSEVRAVASTVRNLLTIGVAITWFGRGAGSPLHSRPGVVAFCPLRRADLS